MCLTLLVSVCMLASNAAASNLKGVIKRELGKHYNQAFQITIQDPGQVTIKGTVPSYWEKRNVYSIVSRIPGVTGVKNELNVDVQPVTNEIIKANIESELKRNREIVEPEKISVTVKDGVVNLGGTVSLVREPELAEDIASWQKGVIRVVNEIHLLPTETARSDENLEIIIQGIINQDFPVEKHSIQGKVQNGEAILTGQVNSLWVKDQVAKEVGRVQGIYTVDNRLELTTRIAKK